LQPKWEGPFKVINITNSGNTYHLQNFVDGGITKRHITDLKVFYHDRELTGLTLSDIALRDHIHEFPVERCLSHRFKRMEDGSVGNKHSDLEFHIHWKGFSSRWDSWEPFKNVRLSSIVIDYMRENKLKRFIPRNLEQDAVEQDEEETHPIAIVNRIRWADQMEEQAQVKEYEDESRWVYCRRTHKWINTEDIRFLGPL